LSITVVEPNQLSDWPDNLLNLKAVSVVVVADITKVGAKAPSVEIDSLMV